MDLPSTPTHSQPRQDEKPSTALHLLVVDDEPLIQRAIARCLPQHRVSCASTGLEALQLATTEPISLILCDLYMPEMDGPTLHRTLLARRPELAKRMIFMTGGANTQLMDRFISTTDLPILEKPFRPTELRLLVERYELGGPSAAQGPFVEPRREVGA